MSKSQKQGTCSNYKQENEQELQSCRIQQSNNSLINRQLLETVSRIIYMENIW